MEVVYLACEGEGADWTLGVEEVGRNARRAYGVLEERGRPRLRVVGGLGELGSVMREKGDGGEQVKPIRWGFALDVAENMPYVFHPDLIYKLNSKRWLAETSAFADPGGIEIIDCGVDCPKLQGHENGGVPMRDGHKIGEETKRWSYDSDCAGCEKAIEHEVDRILEILRKRKLPYVLKLTQSLSSIGTHVVNDENSRRRTLETISEYLKEYLPRITPSNTYLHTTSLIVSDAIQDKDGNPADTIALNFFVPQPDSHDPEPTWLGACTQLATGASARQATAIRYADQPSLEPQYHDILRQISQILQKERYYGFAGADIMTDANGVQYVVDLNVRSALSGVLYLLKGHLYERRGFEVAEVFECLKLRIGRDEFEEEFERELMEGKIVILGVTRLGERREWCYGMVVAGKDMEGIGEVVGRMEGFGVKE